MVLDDLIGKNFKYISKYGDKKECDWIGTVEWVNIIHRFVGVNMFIPIIKIKSVAGPVYDLDELRFFDKPQLDTQMSTENNNKVIVP